ncbi:hypothetical protein SEPCBS119000_000943 [Sporothrix epigloea]|uniref:Uncharacterized protein n=1 Tax=Sporothrix epigloea TaxID=1892477 RepID=A0ABP0D893_9PEZI
MADDHPRDFDHNRDDGRLDAANAGDESGEQQINTVFPSGNVSIAVIESKKNESYPTTSSTEANSSKPTAIAPPEDAHARCETATYSSHFATPAPHTLQAPSDLQNIDNSATPPVTPNTFTKTLVEPKTNSAAGPLPSLNATTSEVAAESIQSEFVSSPGLKLSSLPRPLPQQPAIVRTTSSHGDLPLRQPKPDPNGGLIGIAGSVAQLEETAEQFASQGSIETAIREAHQELKRSDSRRSSILAASIRQASRAASVADPTEADPRREFSRQNSIIELNSAARSGAFSPNNFIMSPNYSISGNISRQLSTSKTASTNSAHNSLMANIYGAPDQPFTGDDVFPFLSRHGSGKTSIRSARSVQASLPEITELDPPISLTQHALDEADRRIAAGEDHYDDDTIRASAHQYINEGDDDDDADAGSESGLHLTLNPTSRTWQPAHGSSAAASSALLSSQSPPPIHRPSVNNFLGYASSPQYPQYVMNSADLAGHALSGQIQMMPELASFPQQFTNDSEPEARVGGLSDTPVEGERELERLATAASGATYEIAQSAFDDFDGVHCDPETASLRRSIRERSIMERQSPAADSPRQTPTAANRQRPLQPVRPTSYLDPQTGRQMLYYPAPVPAMLQLPQKLSRNPKAAERNARRSQIMSMMMQQPKKERQSRAWLPDPMNGESGSHFMGSFNSQSPDLALLNTLFDTPSNLLSSPTGGEDKGDVLPEMALLGLGIDQNMATETKAGLAAQSRMPTLNKLPAELRASAYFDRPATMADIEVKNGSAMETLDSILDAAATAPVSAFTDHAFAGHLGSEVYGAKRKRPKKKPSAAAATRPGPSPVGRGLPASKSRDSFLSMMQIRKVSEVSGDGRSEFEVPRVRRRLSKKFDGAILPPGPVNGADGAMASSDANEIDGHEDGDENDFDEDNDSGDEEEDDDVDDEAYQGAPTTLLAELQLRKQQQKQRTRPINKAFPNGMHSTLLELDAVAEFERRARKGKKVNLAWEEPSMEALNDASEDEDVPLGVLLAAKASGQKDISTVLAEMNRPLGLMEKKELEDNEPLSRRRDRLQGRDPGVSMFLGPSFGSNAVKRQSILNLTPNLAAVRNTNVTGSPHTGEDAHDQAGSEVGVDEVEGESLAARRQRIKAKEESELPRARMVSTNFSEELLGHFVNPQEEAEARAKEAEKAKLQLPAGSGEIPEHRRGRSQPETDARQLETAQAGGLAVNRPALQALTGSDRLSRHLSFGDMLPAYLADAGSSFERPSQGARLQPENARSKNFRDQNSAAIRTHLPRHISDMSIGSGITKPGGYMGGLYNDGSGGIGAMNQTNMVQHKGGHGMGPWTNPSMMGSGFGNANALGLMPAASMGNMAGMLNTLGRNSMGMGGAATYGSGLNNAGLGTFNGMGVHNRSTSYGSYAGMPHQNTMGNSGMAYNSHYNNPVARQPTTAMHNPALNMNMGPIMPTQMPMQMQPPQTDRVERWRQSVLP